MDIFLMIRRKKTTIFLDTKEDATVADVKKMLFGLIKRPPEDQRLIYNNLILEDQQELRHYFQGKAHNPSNVGLLLKEEETGKFEHYEVCPYSDPPVLPSAMEKDDDASM